MPVPYFILEACKCAGGTSSLPGPPPCPMHCTFPVVHGWPAGLFHPTMSNVLPLVGRCDVTGAGASTDPASWRAQLYICGTSDCVDGVNLPSSFQPDLPTCVNYTTTSSCTLPPTAVGYVGSTYTSTFAYSVPQAYRGATTYYAWRCFYLCDSADASSAEQRASATFTVVGDSREEG